MRINEFVFKREELGTTTTQQASGDGSRDARKAGER